MITIRPTRSSTSTRSRIPRQVVSDHVMLASGIDPHAMHDDGEPASEAKVREGPDPTPVLSSAEGAAKHVNLAIPMFGYKNHIGIDRTHRLIRTWDASAANAHVGARLPDLISKENTASGVWADTAHRSNKNEAFFASGLIGTNESI